MATCITTSLYAAKPLVPKKEQSGSAAASITQHVMLTQDQQNAAVGSIR